MLIHQAYRYELKPNNRQRSQLRQAAGTARFAYNWGLAQQFKALEAGEKFPTAIDLHKTLNRLKKTEFSWMRQSSKWIPQEALRDLEKAWKRKCGGLGRAPRFKSRRNKDSFRLYESLGTRGKTVQLPRLGQLRVKESTDAITGRILFATVSREADRWFVSFTVEREHPDPKQPTGKPVGIDLGISTFASFPFDAPVDSPKPLKKNLRKLQRLSKQLSRKQKGSANRRKAAQRLARFHRRVRNQRKDFLHKLSTKLTKTKSVICVETLGIKGLLENKKLSRAISDLGWREFLRQLEYKSSWYGSELVKIDRWFPSTKTCCVCGFKWSELPLSVREWECPSCKIYIGRDRNAALNILLEGLGDRCLEYYPEFQGKLRLWRSCKTSSRGSRGRRSRKQAANV